MTTLPRSRIADWLNYNSNDSNSNVSLCNNSVITMPYNKNTTGAANNHFTYILLMLVEKLF